jgi:hypothetical protein
MRYDLLRKICIVWLTLFATAAVAAEGKTARPDPLLELEADRFRSTAADVDAVEKLLDDDLTYCHTTGRCESKAEYLANLRSGRTKYHKIEVVSSAVRRYGDIAIVNGRITIDVEAGGQRRRD